MKKTEEAGTTRRDFLKVAGSMAPAMAVLAASTTAAEASAPDLSSNKMQDTAHTRAYLASARF